MALTQDQMAALLTEAASIGSRMFTLAATAKLDADKARSAAAEASGVVRDLSLTASGFNAPRFQGMIEVAKAFAIRFNDPDADGAADAAKKAAESFMTTFTGATDKSKSGGRSAGIAQMIRCGTAAEIITFALQQRLDAWQEVHDRPQQDGEDARAVSERKKHAARFLTVASCDHGKPEAPKVPRHNGRPEVTIGDIKISAGNGTNRDAQIAGAAAMYAIHGNKFLDPKVLDAFLDNGGRYEKPGPTLQERAKSIAGLIIELETEAVGSADLLELQNAIKLLDRIASNGFTPSREATTHDIPATPTHDKAESENLDALVAEVSAGDVLSGTAEAKPVAKPANGNAKKRGGLNV